MTELSFNDIIEWDALNETERDDILRRPAVAAGGKISEIVTAIVNNVAENGDAALREYSAKFDRCEVKNFRVSAEEVEAAWNRATPEFRAALQEAASNIEKFHSAEKLAPVVVETMPGVKCEQLTRPIEAVGLYIPGGTAPLFSTVLMLGIPAKIAGCSKVILCSPPPVADPILCAAKLCGIDHIYQVGGAQAVAAMAFGTETIPSVSKIFGPGNAFVTEAKRQVSCRADGAAIDMPAGPSEVLVIADAEADPAFVASDLLSQAEHGPDSQVVLLTPARALAEAVAKECAKQLAELPRKDIAVKSLSASRLIVVKDLDEACAVSNRYAPEHLIIQTKDARSLVPQIQNAGSVFLGEWSPESGGDYATGTNHVLPTYGYAAAYSSLGLADFMKRMTVQEMTPQGFSGLAKTIALLAHEEQLDAHRNAVLVRMARQEKEKA
ncbi:histidinol dehydrogenase [Sutterella sp.]|uniref:histidinol dehydrogenase n=1 Tax=Sutterella sp. TaxID=1981025 RepID=UPI0026E0306D|nr:histidinol dehydrogenase [Sutterella sp.]MDO5531214.1 histidinol dehydrogenase [Sutterella sp.]